MTSAMDMASTSWIGMTRMTSATVVVSAPLNFGSPSMRWTEARPNVPSGAWKARAKAWTPGVAKKTTKNSRLGSRSAYGAQPSREVTGGVPGRRVPPRVPDTARLLDLARSLARRVRQPARGLGGGEDPLEGRHPALQHGGRILPADHDLLEGVLEHLVVRATLVAEPHGQERRQRVASRLLRGDRIGLRLQARAEVARQAGADDREERDARQRRRLGLRLQQVLDQLLRPRDVRGGCRDGEADDDRHEGLALWPGRDREGDEGLGILERVDETRDVVPGDPYLARLERLLHEAIRRGLRVHVLPGLLHPGPHLVRGVAGEGRVHASGEGRIGVTLEEPMEEPKLAGREAELGLAGLGLDVRATLGQLVPCQLLDIGASG